MMPPDATPAQPAWLGRSASCEADVCQCMQDQGNHDITLDTLAGSWRIFQMYLTY